MPSDSHRPGGSSDWRVLCPLVGAALAAAMSMTIMPVAVPAISRAFSLPQDQVHWVSTGFMAAMTLSMLLTPWLMARFTVRGVYAVSICMLLAGAAGASLAPSFHWLVLARLVEGFAAGLLQPLPVIIVSHAFGAGQRGRAMGVFMLGTVLGPAIAPLLGGMLVERWGWQAVSLALVPVAVLALPTVAWLGAYDLSPGTEPRRRWFQLVDLGVFADRRFAMTCVVAFAYGIGMFGSAYLVPVFMQQALGRSAIESGGVMLPAGLWLAVSSPVGGWLTDRLPVHRVVAAGMGLLALALLAFMGIDVNSSIAVVAVCLWLSRMGMALVLPSLNLSAMGSLPSHRWTDGSTVISVVRQFGASVGVSVAAVFLQWRLLTSAEAVGAAAPLPVAAFHDTFALLAGAATLGAAFAWFARSRQPGSGAAAPVRWK